MRNLNEMLEESYCVFITAECARKVCCYLTVLFRKMVRQKKFGAMHFGFLAGTRNQRKIVG